MTSPANEMHIFLWQIGTVIPIQSMITHGEHNLLTACEQICNNLFADLLQLVRFYVCTTRLADLFNGGTYTNCYIISRHQILFKKIKSPKMKGLSLYFFGTQILMKK
jgi:hypothetical protein